MPRAITIQDPAISTSPVVFASPHSGRVYPPEFLTQVTVNQHVLRSSEDAFVDILLDGVTEYGATLVTSDVPRAYVDFNRSATELDPALIEGAPKSGLNPRITSGLGVLARVVANGRAIYRGKISMDIAEARITQYWKPYHQGLWGTLDRHHARFGHVLLCDVHSMPHEALNGHVARGAQRPDIVLGDRWGASCGEEVMHQVEEAFRAKGFVVARNAPFAGAYTIQTYGQPSQARHALQIEIDRALYMDEKRIEPLPGFDGFRSTLQDVFARIARITIAPGRAGKLAAE